MVLLHLTTNKVDTTTKCGTLSTCRSRSSIPLATLDLPPNFKCRPTWHLSFLKPFVPDEWLSSGNVTDFGLFYDDIVESQNIPAPIEDQVEATSVTVPSEDNVNWHLDLFEDD